MVGRRGRGAVGSNPDAGPKRERERKRPRRAAAPDPKRSRRAKSSPSRGCPRPQNAHTGPARHRWLDFNLFFASRKGAVSAQEVARKAHTRSKLLNHAMDRRGRRLADALGKGDPVPGKWVEGPIQWDARGCYEEHDAVEMGGMEVRRGDVVQLFSLPDEEPYVALVTRLWEVAERIQPPGGSAEPRWARETRVETRWFYRATDTHVGPMLSRAGRNWTFGSTVVRGEPVFLSRTRDVNDLESIMNVAAGVCYPLNSLPISSPDARTICGPSSDAIRLILHLQAVWIRRRGISSLRERRGAADARTHLSAGSRGGMARSRGGRGRGAGGSRRGGGSRRPVSPPGDLVTDAAADDAWVFEAVRQYVASVEQDAELQVKPPHPDWAVKAALTNGVTVASLLEEEGTLPLPSAGREGARTDADDRAGLGAGEGADAVDVHLSEVDRSPATPQPAAAGPGQAVAPEVKEARHNLVERVRTQGSHAPPLTGGAVEIPVFIVTSEYHPSSKKFRKPTARVLDLLRAYLVTDAPSIFDSPAVRHWVARLAFLLRNSSSGAPSLPGKSVTAERVGRQWGAENEDDEEDDEEGEEEEEDKEEEDKGDVADEGKEAVDTKPAGPASSGDSYLDSLVQEADEKKESDPAALNGRGAASKRGIDTQAKGNAGDALFPSAAGAPVDSSGALRRPSPRPGSRVKPAAAGLTSWRASTGGASTDGGPALSGMHRDLSRSSVASAPTDSVELGWEAGTRSGGLVSRGSALGADDDYVAGEAGGQEGEEGEGGAGEEEDGAGEEEEEERGQTRPGSSSDPSVTAQGSGAPSVTPHRWTPGVIGKIGVGTEYQAFVPPLRGERPMHGQETRRESVSFRESPLWSSRDAARETRFLAECRALLVGVRGTIVFAARRTDAPEPGVDGSVPNTRRTRRERAVVISRGADQEVTVRFFRDGSVAQRTTSLCHVVMDEGAALRMLAACRHDASEALARVCRDPHCVAAQLTRTSLGARHTERLRGALFSVHPQGKLRNLHVLDARIPSAPATELVQRYYAIKSALLRRGRPSVVWDVVYSMSANTPTSCWRIVRDTAPIPSSERDLTDAEVPTRETAFNFLKQAEAELGPYEMHVLQQLLLVYKDAPTTPASAERTVGFAMTLRNVLSGSPDLARALSLYVGWPHVVM